jgi:hypothetical protein
MDGYVMRRLLLLQGLLNICIDDDDKKKKKKKKKKEAELDLLPCLGFARYG